MEVVNGFIKKCSYTNLIGFSENKLGTPTVIYGARPNIEESLIKDQNDYLEKINHFSMIVIVSKEMNTAHYAFENMAFDHLLFSMTYDRFLRCVDKYDTYAKNAQKSKDC